jgi:hypothetical protein
LSAAEAELEAVSTRWQDAIRELHEERGFVWKTGTLHVFHNRRGGTPQRPTFFSDGADYFHDTVLLYKPAVKLEALTAQQLLNLLVDVCAGHRRAVLLMVRPFEGTVRWKIQSCLFSID